MAGGGGLLSFDVLVIVFALDVIVRLFMIAFGPEWLLSSCVLLVFCCGCDDSAFLHVPISAFRFSLTFLSSWISYRASRNFCSRLNDDFSPRSSDYVAGGELLAVVKGFICSVLFLFSAACFCSGDTTS